MIREFYLSEIDAWQSGKKITPGQGWEQYSLNMRERIKELEKDLLKAINNLNR